MVGELDEENLNLALSTDVSLGKKKKGHLSCYKHYGEQHE